ncbi:MAG: hypothetical protein KAH22_05280 [Thiotrichaceae bacterium]|nr:hypothetical protein [Thiotrichaceae bacterium]
MENLWLFLVPFALISALFGWVLRGSCQRQSQLAREYKERYKELKTRCHQYKENLSTLKQQNKKLSSRLARQQSSMHRLETGQQTVPSLEHKIKEVQHFAKRLQTHVQSQQQELAHYKKTEHKIKEIQDFAKKLQAHVQKQQQELVHYKKTVDQAKSVIGKRNQVIEQLKSENSLNELTQNDLKQRQVEAESSQLEIATLSSQLNNQQNLQQQLEGIEQARAEQHLEIETLQKFVQQAEEDKQAVINELDAFKGQAQEFLTTAMEDTQNYRQGVEFLHSELTQCQSELKEIIEITDTEEDIDPIEEENQYEEKFSLEVIEPTKTVLVVDKEPEFPEEDLVEELTGSGDAENKPLHQQRINRQLRRKRRR